MLAPPCSYAYGFNTSVQRNLWHLDGHRLLYPVGQFLASLDPQDQQVRLLGWGGLAACA